MATQRWLGTAVALKQVTTITISGTWATSETGTLTINGNDLVVTVGTDTTTANVATLIKEAFNGDTQTGTGDHTSSPPFADGGGSAIPEFTEITATVSGSVVTLTGDTAGKPFTVTVSDTAAAGAVGSPSTTTAATGPNHFDNADNWSQGSVPVDNDDIWFDTGDVDCKYGLSQSAVTPASINVTMGFTGEIGLPETNIDNSANTYFEYRDTYLALGTSGDATNIAVSIGTGPGSGSGRIRIDTGSSQATLNISNSGQPAETGVPAILWKGTHASNEVNITKGTVGIGFYAGESATAATLRVGYVTNQDGDSAVQCGESVTLTTVEVTGGTLETNSNITTVNIDGGSLDHAQGTMGTLNCDSGEVLYRSNGTLTTANIGSDGILDFRRDMRARTVTNCSLYEGASYYDPFGTVTHTNGIDLVRCRTSELANFEHDPNITISFSSI